MKSVCLIASKLFPGGFNTSMINMITQLQKHGIHVAVLFLDPQHHEMESNLPEHVELLSLPSDCKKRFNVEQFALSLQLRLTAHDDIKKLSNEIDVEERKHLEVERVQAVTFGHVLQKLPMMDLTSFECVISWEELTCNYYLAMNAKAKKKIGYIHPDYKDAGFSRRIDRLAFDRLDRLVAISKSTADSLIKTFPEFKDKVIYIPNPVDADAIIQKAEAEIPPFSKSAFDIVTVCRLDNQSKALDRLARIASRLNQDGLNYQWYIVGEGIYRQEMETMINELNLTNLHLTGNKSNPYPYIKEADLFVLQSYYEGKPLVVDESKILNTPVLVTEYAAAHEQVNDSIGYVVPMDEHKVYETLTGIIAHPDCLNLLRNNLMAQDKADFNDISKLLREID